MPSVFKEKVTIQAELENVHWSSACIVPKLHEEVSIRAVSFH